MSAKNTNDPKAPAKAAEELARAAAERPDRSGRLWRLEWAQAFRKLADLGGPTRDKDEDDRVN